jgi:hypothetical protein
MVRHLLIILAGSATFCTATSIRRVAQVPSGPDAAAYGKVVCCDSDHDSLPEMVFLTGSIHPADPYRREVWEHQGWNRFSLVFADTGEYPEPPGITTGNAIPFAAGDIDDDGLTDIVCIGIGRDSIDSTAYDVLMTIESPDSFGYPCSLSWYYRFSDLFVIPIPIYYPPDLDNDGHREILSLTPDVTIATGIWENVGNDSNELVWHDTVYGYRFAFGDFDLDGKMDFATGDLGSSGWVEVWECTGDDEYERVYRDTVLQPNGADVFMTRDIDGDSLPEFYVAYENVPRGKMYLYMWEACQAGTDSYRRTLVDSVGFSGTDWGRISECGDIDGDGIDECIWTTPDIIKVYKAVGDNDLEEVWHWNNDHGGFRSLVSTVYDINNDGYNELITAGNAKISIFEVNAVDLVSPNGGDFQPGDTVSIRWVTHSPPRCDSLSLFLRRDSLWNLDTIAHGLPATDTLYRWVVPAGVPDTGRIIVMAYGPGHQYDMSDSAITFTSGGVAEGTSLVPLQWSLSVSPNPARGAFTLRFDVPGKWGQSQPLRGQTEVQSPFSMSLGIYDAGGRLVRSLSQGDIAPGRYQARISSGVLPAGVYFVRLEPSAVSRQPLAVTKVVITR